MLDQLYIEEEVKFRLCKRAYVSKHHYIIQGERTQAVTSNLALTDRKNTINVNLMADSVQGRLGIYAWMITVILSWHLLTLEVFFPKEVKIHRKLPKQSQNCLFLADLTTFPIDLNTALPAHQIW